MFVPANLNEGQIERLQDFEQRQGIRVLALADMQVESNLLDAEKLMGLQDLEQDLGCCLLAVR